MPSSFRLLPAQMISESSETIEAGRWRFVLRALDGSHRLVVEEALKDSKHASKVAAECYKRRNYRAWEAAMKIKHKAEERLINAGGLNKEDMIVPDFDRIQPPNIEISLPPDQIDILRKMASRGAVNFTKDLEVEDTSFEEVPPNEGE